MGREDEFDRSVGLANRSSPDPDLEARIQADLNQLRTGEITLDETTVKTSKPQLLNP